MASEQVQGQSLVQLVQIPCGKLPPHFGYRVEWSPWRFVASVKHTTPHLRIGGMMKSAPCFLKKVASGVGLEPQVAGCQAGE